MSNYIALVYNKGTVKAGGFFGTFYQDVPAWVRIKIRLDLKSRSAQIKKRYLATKRNKVTLLEVV